MFHILVGGYCEEGTIEPVDCPPGTYGAIEGLTNLTECTPCTAGKYCALYGLTTDQG
jgi:hypothetical protein